MIEAAVALVVFEGRALVLRRPPNDRRFPDRWCLPGGQLEPGERAAEGVVRECLEETGLSVSLTSALPARVVQVNDRPIRIWPFDATCSSGRVRLSDEHTEARWISAAHAASAETLLPSGLAGEVTAMMLRRFSESAVE